MELKNESVRLLVFNVVFIHQISQTGSRFVVFAQHTFSYLGTRRRLIQELLHSLPFLSFCCLTFFFLFFCAFGGNCGGSEQRRQTYGGLRKGHDSFKLRQHLQIQRKHRASIAAARSRSPHHTAAADRCDIKKISLQLNKKMNIQRSPDRS